MALGGKILTWYNNQWLEGNTPIIGAADHAAWLGSTVFDGARQFEGVRPDMMLNCQRIVYSAEAFGMMPPINANISSVRTLELKHSKRADVTFLYRPACSALFFW